MKDMNESELLEVLAQEGRPLAVFFYTPLCGTCKAARRMLEVAEHMLPADVIIASCNVNIIPGLVNKFRISSVPALMVVNAERTQVPEIYYAMISVERVLEYIRSVTS
jgi:thioredoxin-like negative regulator of GroEL